MNAEAKAKWVAALRSVAYQQGQGALHRGDTFCPLGVLCDISGLGQWRADFGPEAVQSYHLGSGRGSRFILPYPVVEWAGLPDDTAGGVPVAMNDDDKPRPFAEIADFIEANL